MTDRRSHTTRINRVIDHIDAHLAEPLGLNALATVAHFSPWHFHRVFQAFTGETLADRVRRRRLEVAANRPLASPRTSTLRIALEVGIGSAEAFTRAFKAHFGVTPSAWRRGAARTWIERQREQLSKIHQADRKANQAAMNGFLEDSELWPRRRFQGKRGTAMDVTIRTLPETRVAYMRHVGPYGSSSITRLWQLFAAWCDARGLMKPRRMMFGISHDSPDLTAPEQCRYDACVQVDPSFVAEDEAGVQIISGGRYACASFTGPPSEINGAWMRFYCEWLPDSRYQADDRSSLEVYDTDFSIDPDTGAFTCALCIPIRPL
jgi:AraC family transcriptional regulator